MAAGFTVSLRFARRLGMIQVGDRHQRPWTSATIGWLEEVLLRRCCGEELIFNLIR
jgi:hypothetical protein